MNIQTPAQKRVQKKKQVGNTKYVGNTKAQTITATNINVLPKEDEKIKTLISEVFGVKSKQFVFDCGLIMANLNYDNSTFRFCMGFHLANTGDFDEFVESIKQFISASGNSLTNNDIEKLKTDYKFKTTGSIK